MDALFVLEKNKAQLELLRLGLRLGLRSHVGPPIYCVGPSGPAPVAPRGLPRLSHVGCLLTGRG